VRRHTRLAGEREEHVDLDPVVGGVRCAAYRLLHALADERAAVGERQGAPTGLVVLGAAQAVFALRRRVAVDARQLRGIEAALPFEVVVAHADEQSRRAKVARVARQVERQIIDPQAVASGRGQRGRDARFRAHPAQRGDRDRFVASRRERARVAVRMGHRGTIGGPREQEEGAAHEVEPTEARASRALHRNVPDSVSPAPPFGAIETAGAMRCSSGTSHPKAEPITAPMATSLGK
jgi:hypothetical protein